MDPGTAQPTTEAAVGQRHLEGSGLGQRLSHVAGHAQGQAHQPGVFEVDQHQAMASTQPPSSP